MKKLSYVLVLVLAITAMLISACGGSPAVSSTGGGKPQASHVEFTGVIESMVGSEWTVGGQKITVDPALVPDGTFAVGDTVKVKVQVQADGSMVVSQVEAPGADDNSNDANSNDINSNDDNGNDENSNDVNSNDINSNDDNSNLNSNDSNSNDDNSNINSNDDNSNDDTGYGNSNDDNGNDDSNDDNGNDDSKDDNGNSSNSNGG